MKRKIKTGFRDNQTDTSKKDEEKIKKAAKLLAQSGGRATLKKYGKKHFKELSKKRWDLVAHNVQKSK